MAIPLRLIGRATRSVREAGTEDAGGVPIGSDTAASSARKLGDGACETPGRAGLRDRGAVLIGTVVSGSSCLPDTPNPA